MDHNSSCKCKFVVEKPITNMILVSLAQRVLEAVLQVSVDVQYEDVEDAGVEEMCHPRMVYAAAHYTPPLDSSTPQPEYRFWGGPNTSLRDILNLEGSEGDVIVMMDDVNSQPKNLFRWCTTINGWTLIQK